MRPHRLGWALVLLATIATTACGRNTITPPDGDPVVTAVTIAAPIETITVGQEITLVATARDAGGEVIQEVTFAWQSSDPAVATVSGTGVVTAAGRGSARITASTGSVEGHVDLSVTIPALTLTRDTVLGGTIEALSFEIPDGVSVTVSSDLTLISDGDILVSGTLVADCRALELRGGGDLLVRGTISNECSNLTSIGAPLRLRVDGAIEIENAEIFSFGDIEISNDGEAGAPVAILAAGFAAAISRSGGVAMTNESDKDCRYRDVRVGRFDAEHYSPPPAADGSPRGADGVAGRRTRLGCRGFLLLWGSNMLDGGRGQAGGRGTATATQAALGGAGGRGGDVVIVGGTGVEIVGSPGFSTSLEAGSGGAGGAAMATGSAGQRSEAFGGDGGLSGLVRIRALTGTIAVKDPLRITFRQQAEGGEAEAHGANGADATAAQPAQPGQVAIAEGGAGGDVGESPGWNLLGDIFEGEVVGAENVVLVINVTPAARPASFGGRAVAVGGAGGAGNEVYPDGASGGDMTARGGRGSDSWLRDNRNGGSWVEIRTLGGDAFFLAGNGGPGYGVCAPQASQGGAGGRGGRATGGANRGGRSGPELITGTPGTNHLGGIIRRVNDIPQTISEPTGNGARGGDGNGPGAGGAAGGRELDPTGPVQELHAEVFLPGSPGNPCPPPEPSTTLSSDVWYQHGSGESYICVMLATTPARPGATAVAQVTGPGVVSTSPLTGSLMPDGRGRFRFTINSFGTYQVQSRVVVEGVTIEAPGQQIQVTGSPGTAPCQ